VVTLQSSQSYRYKIVVPERRRKRKSFLRGFVRCHCYKGIITHQWHHQRIGSLPLPSTPNLSSRPREPHSVSLTLADYSLQLVQLHHSPSGAFDTLQSYHSAIGLRRPAFLAHVLSLYILTFLCVRGLPTPHLHSVPVSPDISVLASQASGGHISICLASFGFMFYKSISSFHSTYCGRYVN
jgi:hypothetical protein